MPWPDYGTPGNPSMDPYYVSPAEERRREEDRRANIDGTIDAYREDLRGVLLDLVASLKSDGAELVSVTVDLKTMDVKVVAK